MKKHIIALLTLTVLFLTLSAAANNIKTVPASADSVAKTQTVGDRIAVTKAPEGKIAVSEMSAEQIMSSPVGEVMVSRFDEMLTERLDKYDSGMRKRSRDRFLDRGTLGIIAVFGFPFIFSIVALVTFTRYLDRRGERRARMIELSLRCGQPLPPEFYQRRKRNQVQTGLTWIAWGAGLMIFFLVVGAEPPAALMAVPCLIGVSKLLTILIESRKGGRAE